MGATYETGALEAPHKQENSIVYGLTCPPVFHDRLVNIGRVSQSKLIYMSYWELSITKELAEEAREALEQHTIDRWTLSMLERS